MDKKEWSQYIRQLRKETEALPHKDEAELKEELKKAIINAIKKSIPKEKFAIFFSGGVDSSLIALVCKQLKADFTCYCVGYKTQGMEVPQDIIWAEKVAKELKLNFVKKIFNQSDAEKIIKQVVKILPHKEVDIQYVTNIGVGAVVVGAYTIAKEKVFLSGLGSEEIFAGYERHKRAEEKHEECWKGLEKIYERDLTRDLSIAEALGFKIEVPFLDDEVIKAAMRIHIDRKINEEHKKIILREIAEELGLKHEFAWRKKLGAQYGSKFDRAIKKLALKAGHKYRKDYLKTLI
ncbi:MAG: asparagine synthase C-terminal domain-containing protein [Nanoarchaeota archaeon]|nr:asparagine synthase C-terminal domain-containing protein [Nanoarchaeota archaeon]